MWCLASYHLGHPLLPASSLVGWSILAIADCPPPPAQAKGIPVPKVANTHPAEWNTAHAAALASAGEGDDASMGTGELLEEAKKVGHAALDNDAAHEWHTLPSLEGTWACVPCRT